MATDPQREKALELALGTIEKAYGKGSIMKLGTAEAADVPVISTGSISLDLAVGVGGYPRGRIIEIYGPRGWGQSPATAHVGLGAQAGVSRLSVRWADGTVQTAHDVPGNRRLVIRHPEALEPHAF